MNRPPRCVALVPCAGVGERAAAGRPKQYAPVAGQALVAHTLAALHQVRRLSAVLVVLAPTDSAFETAAPAHQAAGGWIARCGGATRAATVAAGLDDLAARGLQRDDWVLVHDAARCLLQPAWVDRLIDACLDDPVGGLLALPVADTLKREGDADGRSVATIDRRGLWAAQTPQMFRLGLLRDALRAAGDAVTDEASAVEMTGLRPRLVVGDSRNLKVTWPADFDVASRALATGSAAGVATSGAPA